MSTTPDPNLSGPPLELVDRRRQLLFGISVVVNLVILASLVMENWNDLSREWVFLALLGWFTWTSWLNFQNPWRISVDAGRLRMRSNKESTLEIPWEDVEDFRWSPTALRIAVGGLRRMEPQQALRYFHPTVIDQQLWLGIPHAFTLAQTNELRARLKLPPQPPAPPEPWAQVWFGGPASLEPTSRIPTYIMMGVLVLIFLAMVASGVSMTNPTVGDLVNWGANAGVLTSNGEWWRLFTCAFLHAGVVHVMCNTYVLFFVGPQVERLYGWLGFFTIFLSTAFLASLTSLYWNPWVISVGASGSVMGLFGASLAYTWMHRRTAPPQLMAAIRSGTMYWIGLNLFIGFVTPRVDNAAHIGGLLGGMLVGAGLCLGGKQLSISMMVLRWVGVCLGSAVLIAAAILNVTPTYTLWNHGQILNEAVRRTNEVNTQLFAQGNASQADTLAALDNELLPLWRSTRDKIVLMDRVSEADRAHYAQLVSELDTYLRELEAKATAVKNGEPDALNINADEMNQTMVRIKRLFD